MELSLILSRHAFRSNRRCSSTFLTTVWLWKKYWHKEENISACCARKDTKTTLSDQSLYCLVSSFAKRLVGPWLSGLQNSTMKCRSSDQSVEGSLWPQDSEWFELSEILPVKRCQANRIKSCRTITMHIVHGQFMSFFCLGTDVPFAWPWPGAPYSLESQLHEWWKEGLDLKAKFGSLDLMTFWIMPA